MRTRLLRGLAAILVGAMAWFGAGTTSSRLARCS